MELKYKTNINCGSCVSKVQKNLDELVGVDNWKVDTNHPDKILTIKNTKVDKKALVDIVSTLGYSIVPLKISILDKIKTLI